MWQVLVQLRFWSRTSLCAASHGSLTQPPPLLHPVLLLCSCHLFPLFLRKSFRRCSLSIFCRSARRRRRRLRAHVAHLLVFRCSHCSGYRSFCCCFTRCPELQTISHGGLGSCTRFLRRAAASTAFAAGARPPVMLCCQLLIPHVRHPWSVCKEGTAIYSSFLSASNQGGAAEPGAVVTQFRAAAPAVKGAGCTPDRRGYTPAQLGRL